MRTILIFFLSFTSICWACSREPSVYHSKVDKIRGDNGYRINILENPEKYIPGQMYTVVLMGARTFNKIQHFRRFTLNVEVTNEPTNISPQRVGTFQLFGDNLSKFNENCVNTISETNNLAKTEISFLWKAPPVGSGCLTFRAMVLEDDQHWYSEDGQLSKEICEQTEKDRKITSDDCCACDEAKYKLIFEGIWSKATHPKDFPAHLWLTHLSDMIGASHEKNFTFWGEGMIATDGMRSLAEWGSVRLMESELKAQSKYLRSIIKIPGLWYPNVNTNTTGTFRVDRLHHLVSLSSMLGPSPDWLVGVISLDLCQKDCTWIESKIIDLFPYDAGTDGGISYMSPNVETVPREKMYKITTTYPEDPRAPFYDPSKKEMNPLAKLYLFREKVIPKSCDDNFLAAQVDLPDDTEDSSKPECAVTEYTEFGPCSVTCGKGLRMRTREYRMPQKAQMFQCSRQLVSKEMCVSAVPECEGGTNQAEDNDSEEKIEENEGVCKTSPWTEWSSCSNTCGVGSKVRTRNFLDQMGRKKCPHVSVYEREKCMGPPCANEEQEIADPMCPVTEWSDWGPCSATCGKGVKMRTRLLLVEPGLQEKCSSRVEMIQQRPCVETEDCRFDMATAKEVCMQENIEGPCNGHFNRWYFESRKLMCVPFVYGGCRGNKNNFLTAEECNEACRVVRDIISGSSNGNGDSQSPQTPSVIASQEIPIDCMITDWFDWSPCSKSCGSDGVSTRSRMIKRRPSNGGKPCPRRLTQTRRCNLPPCSGDIIFFCTVLFKCTLRGGKKGTSSFGRKFGQVEFGLDSSLANFTAEYHPKMKSESDGPSTARPVQIFFRK